MLQATMTLNNTPTPYTITATTLGVTIDRGMWFNTHTDNMNTKAKTRLIVLWTLTNTNFANPENTLPWCKTSASGSYSDTPTQHGTWTQNQHTYKNFKPRKIERFDSQPDFTRKFFIIHLNRDTLIISLKQHTLVRGTHFYTSKDCSTHPLHHLRGSSARIQRARPPRTVVSKLYQTELDSLPPHTGEMYCFHVCNKTLTLWNQRHNKQVNDYNSVIVKISKDL